MWQVIGCDVHEAVAAKKVIFVLFDAKYQLYTGELLGGMQASASLTEESGIQLLGIPTVPKYVH